MAAFERNDRAVLVVLDRVHEVLLREADGRVQRRDDALGDRDAEDLACVCRGVASVAAQLILSGALTLKSAFARLG